MEGHKRTFDDLDFEAERVDDKIVFTMSGGELYARCHLNFADIIQLNVFLSEEIEDWLIT